MTSESDDNEKKTPVTLIKKSNIKKEVATPTATPTVAKEGDTDLKRPKKVVVVKKAKKDEGVTTGATEVNPVSASSAGDSNLSTDVAQTAASKVVISPSAQSLPQRRVYSRAGNLAGGASATSGNNSAGGRTQYGQSQHGGRSSNDRSGSGTSYEGRTPDASRNSGDSVGGSRPSASLDGSRSYGNRPSYNADSSRPQGGGYQGGAPRTGGYQGGQGGGYQGGAPRTGGYQGGQGGGYQGGAPRTGGYQGGQGGGYQGGAPRTGGYQGGQGGGYQGGAPRTGGYQGGQGGGYQGGAPRTGGYQGGQGGGYQGGAPRTGGYQGGQGGGYQGGAPRTGGYQGGQGGGYQGGAPRTGGYQGGQGGGYQGGAPRTGGYQGGQTTAPSPSDLGRTGQVKKNFKGKKNYTPTRQQIDAEKAFHQKRKLHLSTQAVPSTISIMGNITVADLAKKMNLKASELIGKLMGMGVMVTINQQIDSDTATILASEYRCEVKVVSLYDETVLEMRADAPEELLPRTPIVTIMGHVDHGKTKTLDAIRRSNVAQGEAGAITQHIGAYAVTTAGGKRITFLDTPGHEAFSAMRARGASVTDIVVLVVSGTEGLMAQTKEAINQAQEAGAPIIVAVNKMDLPDASLERVQQQLSDYNLVAENWGGTTMFVPISALRGDGIDALLEAILLQAEIMELTTNPNRAAEGSVIEARIDPGRGIAATILLSRGTLRVGDPFLAGIYSGKVRAMYDDLGHRIQEALPAQPVEITGFSEGAPRAGDPFQVTKDEAEARQVAMKRQELHKQEEAKNVKKVTLSNLYDTISESNLKELRLIIKGDVQGSVEALKQALEKLSNSEIRLVVLTAAAGAIVEQDVKTATTAGAIIIGFHVRPTAKAQLLAEQEKVEIRKYNLIYEVVEDITMAMEGLLSPELREEVMGQAEVRKVFSSSKIGNIAGCMIISGHVTRKARIHILRDSVVIGDCQILGLKREKDDVKEVKEGYECGLTLEGYSDIKMGDILEAYEVKEIKRTLIRKK